VERIDQREKQEIERDTPLQFKNITMRGGALARLLDQALEVEPQYKSLERFLRKQTYEQVRAAERTFKIADQARVCGGSNALLSLRVVTGRSSGKAKVGSIALYWISKE
jgi:hypothetical protein